MRLKTRKYDIIVSLGGNCSAANQLRHRGLRRVSLPFDWTLMADVAPIKALQRFLSNNFNGFLEFSNAVAYEPAIIDKGQTTHHIEDTASGFKFIHHFRGDVFNQTLFESVKAVMIRRITRFFRLIRASKRVLFVLETSFAYDLEIADSLFASLRRAFPAQDIHIVVMQFGATANTERRSPDEKAIFCTYQRALNTVYDNQFTAPEWSWMDSLELTGVPRPENVRKNNLLIKWIYKIWWTLGKWLEKEGAGVMNIRFRDFGEYSFEESAQRSKYDSVR